MRELLPTPRAQKTHKSQTNDLNRAQIEDEIRKRLLEEEGDKIRAQARKLAAMEISPGTVAELSKASMKRARKRSKGAYCCIIIIWTVSSYSLCAPSRSFGDTTAEQARPRASISGSYTHASQPCQEDTRISTASGTQGAEGTRVAPRPHSDPRFPHA